MSQRAVCWGVITNLANAVQCTTKKTMWKIWVAKLRRYWVQILAPLNMYVQNIQIYISWKYYNFTTFFINIWVWIPVKGTFFKSFFISKNVCHVWGEKNCIAVGGYLIIVNVFLIQNSVNLNRAWLLPAIQGLGAKSKDAFKKISNNIYAHNICWSHDLYTILYFFNFLCFI